MINFSEFRNAFECMPTMFPTDMGTFDKAIKHSADFGEKMSKVAIEAAEKNVAISTEWSRETLARLRKVAEAKEDPSDYGQALNEFASESASTASDHITAITEVAKNAQKESLEIFLDAGKEARK